MGIFRTFGATFIGRKNLPSSLSEFKDAFSSFPSIGTPSTCILSFLILVSAVLSRLSEDSIDITPIHELPIRSASTVIVAVTNNLLDAPAFPIWNSRLGRIVLLGIALSFSFSFLLATQRFRTYI